MTSEERWKEIDNSDAALLLKAMRGSAQKKYLYFLEFKTLKSLLLTTIAIK